MIYIIPISSADPAPFIFTLRTCHMFTSFIFFDRNITLRTFLRFNCDRPIFKELSLLLIACLIFVPSYITLKAEIYFAKRACNLSCCFLWSLNHILTLWIWAIFFKVTPHHFFVFPELLKLLENRSITYLLNKFIGYWLVAPFLRAFNE